MLLIAVHHPEVGGVGQIVPALAVALRDPVPLVVGQLNPQARFAPGAPGCLPLGRGGPS